MRVRAARRVLSCVAPNVLRVPGMRAVSPFVLVALVPSLGALYACAQGSPPGFTHGCTDQTSAAIIGGTTATAYPEAVLVDMSQNGQITAACSGSVIAPQVVLTAGHCVDGFDGWQVKAPFAKGQSANASDGETYDWAENGADTVNPDHHDIGLVYLSSKITLSAYPTLAKQPLADGASIVNVGRIGDGTFSTTSLFVSAPTSVSDGAGAGFPFDYSADEIIESGDSGGPDEVAGATPHVIVAVNSGAGSGSEVLARVDLIYDWIQTKVLAHGGFASATPPAPDAGTGMGTGTGNGGGGAGSSSGDPGDPGSDGSGNGSTPPAPSSNPCKR